MAKINLLPWRAERRERRKREFFTQLGIAAVAAVVVVLLWGFWMSLRIDNQNDRNAYLKGQITQLDAKIAEIKNLQKVKDQLLARKKIVEKLQSSRSQMVHLFDQVVQTIPSGARLTAMKQQGDKLTLDGVAQSNATVAQYMRNIEASPWMGPAQLVKTENVHNDSNTPYEFELVVTLGTPKTGQNAEPAVGSSAALAAASSVAPVRSAASVSANPTVLATSAAAPDASTAAKAAPAPAVSGEPTAIPRAASKPATAKTVEHAPAVSATTGGARP